MAQRNKKASPLEQLESDALKLKQHGIVTVGDLLKSLGNAPLRERLETKFSQRARRPARKAQDGFDRGEKP